MLTRLLNSAFATTAIGFAAATTGVLIVVCFAIGAAHLLIWIGGII